MSARERAIEVLDAVREQYPRIRGGRDAPGEVLIRALELSELQIIYANTTTESPDASDPAVDELRELADRLDEWVADQPWWLRYMNVSTLHHVRYELLRLAKREEAS